MTPYPLDPGDPINPGLLQKSDNYLINWSCSYVKKIQSPFHSLGGHKIGKIGCNLHQSESRGAKNSPPPTGQELDLHSKDLLPRRWLLHYFMLSHYRLTFLFLIRLYCDCIQYFYTLHNISSLIEFSFNYQNTELTDLAITSFLFLHMFNCLVSDKLGGICYSNFTLIICIKRTDISKYVQENRTETQKCQICQITGNR